MTGFIKAGIIFAMTRILLFLSFFVVSFVLPQGAKADYFLWEEPKTGLTITFPDTWKRQSAQHPDEVLRVAGPSEGGNPICTVQIADDNRYTIFPPDYGDAVQRVAVSIPFWKSYMQNYDDYTIDHVYDGGGLGRWLASYAMGSYSLRDGTVLQNRQGLMFASLYHDKIYIAECTSLNHAFGVWNADFRSIIKSIDFKKTYHEHKTGDYAHFLGEAEQYFWAQTGPEGTTAY